MKKLTLALMLFLIIACQKAETKKWSAPIKTATAA